jgi:hypothetical protein
MWGDLVAILWNALEHSFEENQRWAWLRAIEWKAWPGFISQPVIPILFVFFQVYEVILALLLVNCLWIPLRWRLISVSLASSGAVFVVCTKWPSCILMYAYFIFKGNYVPAFLAIFWPFIGSLVSFPCAVSEFCYNFSLLTLIDILPLI